MVPTELVARSKLEARVAEYVAAIAECEPAVVKSMKRQMNALAAGDREQGDSRQDYERSLASEELKRRLSGLAKRR